MPQIEKSWEFKLEKGTKTGELFIYGPILGGRSWWDDDGIYPQKFRDELKKLGDIAELNVYINSGGGDAFAGMTINNMLRRHSATVNIFIDGLAASAASIIAMAGDHVVMPRNTMLMVHRASIGVWGNVNDMEKTAERLRKVDKLVVAAYQEKSGLGESEIEKLIDATTYLTPEEALEKGFIDEVEEGRAIAASLDGNFLNINGQKFDISEYGGFPREYFNSMGPNQRTNIEGQGDQLGQASEQIADTDKNNPKTKGAKEMEFILEIGGFTYEFATQESLDKFKEVMASLESANETVEKQSTQLSALSGRVETLEGNAKVSEQNRRIGAVDTALTTGKLNKATHEKYVNLAKTLDDAQWALHEDILDSMPKIVEFGKEHGPGPSAEVVTDSDKEKFEVAQTAIKTWKLIGKDDAFIQGTEQYKTYNELKDKFDKEGSDE